MARRFDDMASESPPEVSAPPAESPTPAATQDAPAEPPLAPLSAFVCDGHSVFCLRGTLQGGDAVFPRDFHRGQDQLDELVASGALVRR